jgi:hypothetical protein
MAVVPIGSGERNDSLPTYTSIRRADLAFRFEVEIGIIAACAPAIRPGYVWLYPKITSSFRSSKGPSKLSDEVRLKQFKGEPVVHQDQGYSWGTGGNDVSDDAEWGAPVSPYDQIRKTTDVDIEQGPPTGAHAGEQVKF